MKPWIALREIDGAFHKLLKDLVTVPNDFKNYLRMHLPTFKELVLRLETSLISQETHLRNPIPPSEQLAETLRFLATGESYSSLQYQFRISKSTHDSKSLCSNF